MEKYGPASPPPLAGPEAPSEALAGCFQKASSLLYHATPLDAKSLRAWGVATMTWTAITSNSLLITATGEISDWQTLPLWGYPSLEEEVEAGDRRERDEAREKGEHVDSRITVPQMPLPVLNSIYYLVGRHEILTSMGQVSRFVSRCGIKVLGKVQALKDLEDLWLKAYLARDEELQAPFLSRGWQASRILGSTRVMYKLSVYRWVAAEIARVGVVTGLPRATIAVVAVVAGLSQSIEWLPEDYVDTFALGFREFVAYLEHRVSSLRRFLE